MHYSGLIDDNRVVQVSIIKNNQIINDEDSVIVWNGYDNFGNTISLPIYVENNSFRLREKYLNFISSLSNIKIINKKLPDYFCIRDGFSYWWMNLLVEKSPFKSPKISDCIKLIALEELLVDKKISKLNLTIADKEICNSIKRMCLGLKIEFYWNPIKEKVKISFLERGYRNLPWIVQGLISLRHLFKKFRLTAFAKPKWQPSRNSIFFMSYFMHLDSKKCENGEYSAAYWGNLPELLTNLGYKTNWIHLFLFSKAVPSIKKGMSLLQAFNKSGRSQSKHVFLECYISSKILFAALKDWLRLQLLAFGIKKIEHNFYLNNSNVWLWPMLKNDFYKSILGQTALENCIWVCLFDEVMKSMPRQEIGFYLYENQAWEMAFISAWNKYGHGKLIGVQHSTTPFWHLYNSIDLMGGVQGYRSLRPLPSYWAVNGSAAKDAFIKFGYPKKRIIESEALRYHDIYKKRLIDADNQRCYTSNKLVNILILGDIQLGHTRKMLEIIDGSISLLPKDFAFKFSFKAHPSQFINIDLYENINAMVLDSSLERVLSKFDIAIAANGTSASIDALINGLFVAVAYDDGELNLNPLKNFDGTPFFSNSEELSNLIGLFLAQESSSLKNSVYSGFYFSEDLKRWKSLISSLSKDVENEY